MFLSVFSHPSTTSDAPGKTGRSADGEPSSPPCPYIRYTGWGKQNIKKKDMIERPRIINVVRKPRKCPVCGERVVDIIYGTGEMTEIEYLLEYRREGIMGGDNIPRRPPIWACCCGCKRFRKVNPDGTDAAVKVKMLKDIRPTITKTKRVFIPNGTQNIWKWSSGMTCRLSL